MNLWGGYVENNKKNNDFYDVERIYHDEIDRLDKKSINLMRIADDLLQYDSEYSSVCLENQKLNKENQLLNEKIHFLEEKIKYLKSELNK